MNQKKEKDETNGYRNTNGKESVVAEELGGRAAKPFVIGRKNWLFANTPSGAKASATAFSIIETAKENDLDPYEYLKYVFEKAPNLKENESIDILLPWNEPDDCRSKGSLN